MTVYRLYLRSHVRRESFPARPTDHAAGPSVPSPKGRPSMIYDNRRYSYVIHGCQEFETDNDATALAIARNIFDAAGDLCDAFELWDGTRHIQQSRMAALRTSARSRSAMNMLFETPKRC